MSDAVGWIVIGVLVVLCAGTPDLLDGLIAYVHTWSACR
jgi:hypothetical protein